MKFNSMLLQKFYEEKIKKCVQYIRVTMKSLKNFKHWDVFIYLYIFLQVNYKQA